MNKRSIIIGGDIVPTKSNYDLFSQGDILSLVGDEINALLSSYDFRIFNLETPLCNTEKPTKKWGPNLAAPTSTIKGIKLLNPSLLVTGNNHIMDQNIQGYLSTIETLKNNKINSVGSGENLARAVIPYIYEKDGVKVGIYSCADHEFSTATESKSGANPFDVLESLDHIVNLKSVCDYVIVLYHGGLQHYSYPKPLLQKACRKMAEKGADLIICQQSHCIGSYEEYCGSTIVYGQGNFVFDYSTNELEQTSLLKLIGVNLRKECKLNLFQFAKCKIAFGWQSEKQQKKYYLHFMSDQNAHRMMDSLSGNIRNLHKTITRFIYHHFPVLENGCHASTTIF